MRRTAGILLSISSLPSRYGIGSFSRQAYAFVDQLQQMGQSLWQILPLHPTGYGDSPYQSFSTFAGNPYFISLEALVEEGVLTLEECEAPDWGADPSRVDYARLYQCRYPLLRKAYERSNITGDPGYLAFISENHWWLDDFALFMALKQHFAGKPWYDWPEEIRLRRQNAIDDCRRVLYFEVEFQMYMQYKFFQQYRKLKAYANARGIRLLGDIPIYVSMDSADTWANPQLFQLDAHNKPLAVAGCPPDGFSATGQLWGNPLYRWDYHQKTGYQWWCTRLWYCYQLYDVTRIDHFRGFDAYYAIPYGEETAVNGWWEKGPGMDLFNTVREKLGYHEVIAEDLGYVTDSVRQLVKASGFPNMKVLEFAFDARDTGSASDYLPHNYAENCVAYTGTHDNETLVSWLNTITKDELGMVRDYLCDHHTPRKHLNKSLIALVMRSAAKYCIIPMQDYLGLDNAARMNHPSTLGKNWQWRMLPDQLDAEKQKEILQITTRYGRSAPQPKKEKPSEA